jgi:hypothetical protein
VTFNPLTSYEIIGLLLTSGAAVLTYLRSSGDAKTQNAAMASVIGAVLTLVLGLRFDTIPKMQEQLVQADVIRKDPVRRQLLEHAATLGPSIIPANPLAVLVLNARMDNLQEQFDQIAVERFIVNEAEMPLFNIRMIQSAKKTIETTNFIGLSKWWTEPWGERYEEANERVAGTGVSVTRIFIFSSRDDMPLARDIMLRELTHRIHVRYALLTDLPPFTGDVIVIDGQLVGQHHITPGKGVSEALFSLNASDVNSVRLTFQTIDTNSRAFQP